MERYRERDFEKWLFEAKNNTSYKMTKHVKRSDTVISLKVKSGASTVDDQTGDNTVLNGISYHFPSLFIAFSL